MSAPPQISLRPRVRAARRSAVSFGPRRSDRPHGVQHGLRDDARCDLGQPVPLVDLEVVSYDYEWAQFTADYLELARDQIGAWRIAYTERQADRVRLPDFDTWLVHAGR